MDAIWGTTSNGIPQAVTIHKSSEVPTSSSVDIFAIVHALLDRVNGCARPTRFLTLLTLCPARRSVETFTRLYLWSRFEICNNNQPFPSMSQSQSIRWVEQKPDNNCQVTRIVTKRFVQFFSPLCICNSYMSGGEYLCNKIEITLSPWMKLGTRKLGS